MNWNIVKGNWKQFKGVIQGQWGRLTDDPVDEVAGKRGELEGKIQETYGETQDEVEKAVAQFSERDKK
ncbi:MAG: CsbD family protein [Sedimenticolaceae bacterium]